MALLAATALLFARGAVAAVAEGPPGPQAAIVVDSFQRDLERLLRRDRVAGAQAAILHRGEVVWEGSAGLADRATGVAVDDDTVFQVASLSKPVTALGVLLLVEDGRIDLDRPVWDYIRSWHLPPSPYDAAGVTARRLLSHRAGIGVHGYAGVDPDGPLPTLLQSLDGANGGAGRVELVAAPDSTTLYSSGGYTLLQLLVEEVSGEPFAAFMERRVLAPLGMTRSTFEPRLGAVRGARSGLRLATGHGWWGGTLPPYRFREQAASGLLSTAGDIARFLAVLGSPQARARVGISPSSIEALLEPLPGSVFALGLAVEPAPTGLATPVRVVSQTGANRGFHAILGGAPERGDGFVVLTNSDRGLAMTTDLYCSWGDWASEVELASCWVERKRRGTLIAVAALLGLGLLMDSTAFARRQWRALRAPPAERAQAPAERAEASAVRVERRHPWAHWVRLAIALALLGGWWLFWYSDFVALRRDGIEHFVPASAQPPTFFWLTAVLTSWCLLGIARWLAVVRSSPQASERPAAGESGRRD